MATFNGQTDQILTIKLQSFIVAAQWLQTEVAAGGEAALEVRTAYVGDGAPIEVTVTSTDGKECGKISGAVISQIFRARLTLAKDAVGPMKFKAKLSKHGLESMSGEMRVWPWVSVENLRWLNGDGKSLSEWPDGTPLTCEGQCKGAPEKVEALVTLSIQTAHGDAEWLSIPTQVEKGKATVSFLPNYGARADKLKTQAQLQPTGEKYQQPHLIFRVFCLGAVGVSEPLAVLQSKVLLYEMAPGEAGEFAGKAIKVTDPSGETTSYTIPENGRIEIPKTKPGNYAIDESEVAHLL